MLSCLNFSNIGRKKVFIPLVVYLCLILLILIVIFLVNVSRIGPLESCLFLCSRYPTDGTNEFKILNLNMLHGYPDFTNLSERLEIIAQQINSISPEFVILQEVPWTWSTRSSAKYLAEKTGLNYVYLPANGNRWLIQFAEGEAILSKYPLKDVDFIELHPSADFFENRVALKVTAAAPWGDIHLVNTHLTHQDPAVNNNQLHSLYQFISGLDGGSVIVAGDFNATESSSQIAFLKDKWIDTYRQVNRGDPGFTCCIDNLTASGAENKLTKRIDYIYLAPGQQKRPPTITDSQRMFISPFEFGELKVWASDHLGVMTTFEVLPEID